MVKLTFIHSEMLQVQKKNEFTVYIQAILAGKFVKLTNYYSQMKNEIMYR